MNKLFIAVLASICFSLSAQAETVQKISCYKEDDTKKTACAFLMFTEDNHKKYGKLTLNPWWSSSWDAARGISVYSKSNVMDWLLGDATYETREQGGTGYGPEPLFSVIIAKKHLMKSGSFDVTISNRGIAGAAFKCKAVVEQ